LPGRDAIDDTLVVGRAEVGVFRSRLDSLVTGRHLNFFHRRAVRCQPGAERMAVAVPDVSGDPSVLEAWVEPLAGDEVFHGIRKDNVGALLTRTHPS